MNGTESRYNSWVIQITKLMGPLRKMSGTRVATRQPRLSNAFNTLSNQRHRVDVALGGAGQP